MLRTSLGYILVRTFPECAIVLLIGCYFLNLKISMATLLKKTLMLGVIQSCIRMLPISFGIHTIIGMALVLFVLVNMSEKSFINCIMALCKIFLCLILSESIYIWLLIDVLNVPEMAIVNNYTVMGAIYSLPCLILFAVLCILLELITKRFQRRGKFEPNK